MQAKAKAFPKQGRGEDILVRQLFAGRDADTNVCDPVDTAKPKTLCPLWAGSSTPR
jgi:hypothetical protein